MSKATVTRLFAGAILAAACGLVLTTATVVAAIADGVVSFGPTVVTVNADALAGMLGWIAIASLVSGLGALAALASWIGALVNTVRLVDKTWFVALLVLGLCSFGWAAMVAYVIAGPDSTTTGAAGSGIAAAGEI